MAQSILRQENISTHFFFNPVIFNIKIRKDSFIHNTFSFPTESDSYHVLEFWTSKVGPKLEESFEIQCRF